MILKTRDSVYEVRQAEKLFRKVVPATGAEPSWSRYDRIGPVEPGQPARFFMVQDERGRSLHYRIITTSPVVEILPAA